MADKELEKRCQILKTNLAETWGRIRRYTLDPRLKEQPGEQDDSLRKRAEEAAAQWLQIRARFGDLPDNPTASDLKSIEGAWLELDHRVDLIQRELISEQSFNAGVRTAVGLAVTMLLLIACYLFTHGMRSLDFSTFEPWPEWGPLKYGEVVWWSLFGVLCYLLYTASYYLTRRDFDVWYWPWYVSTALRAPFLTLVLMVILLEFTEWYGEGKWIQTYLLEEGNKYYFIVFLSFCLGLASHTTATVMREVSEGVAEFVSTAASRVHQKLGLAVTKADSPGK